MREPASWAGLVLVFVAAPAWSWGPQGHRTTGAIADRLLNDQAKAMVAQLLSGDLDSKERPSHRTTLEAVSVWPDEIRNTPASHPLWHYDNVPACGTPDKAKYCKNGECNTAQTERLLVVLAVTTATYRDRNEALKWIVHLIGDIHQLLHADDNADHGGNLVNVALAGMKTKGKRELHGVWDNEFVTLALATKSTTQVPPEINALARQAKALVALRGQGDTEAWALESNQLARKYAYDYPAFACGAVPNKIVILSAHYQTQAARVVRERLLLGGARLATVLNQTLGGAH